MLTAVCYTTPFLDLQLLQSYIATLLNWRTATPCERLKVDGMLPDVWNVETTEGPDQLVSWLAETLLSNTSIHRIYLDSSRASTSAVTAEVSEVNRNSIYVIWPASCCRWICVLWRPQDIPRYVLSPHMSVQRVAGVGQWFRRHGWQSPWGTKFKF